MRINQTILKNAKGYTVALVLQVLTHRYQDGDEELMLFARAWPSSVNGSDWAIMLLSAELTEVISSGDSRIKTPLTTRITSLLSWKGRRQRRANGLIGYLLVEYFKAAGQRTGNPWPVTLFNLLWTGLRVPGLRALQLSVRLFAVFLPTSR